VARVARKIQGFLTRVARTEVATQFLDSRTRHADSHFASLIFTVMPP
jgi:hypothetical protein